MKDKFLSSPRHFLCTRCSRCCAGQPGFVWLSISDLDLLCNYLGMSKREFALAFCKPVDIGIKVTLSLKEKPNNDCIFLSEQGCSVYEARPTQCRTYPFWEHLVEEDRLWMEEARECPGIGRGPLVDPEYIVEAILARRENPPLSMEEIPELASFEKEYHA